MPDRSTVTLNTHSAIALSFDDRARRVRLFKGEALFTVQHDEARPFLVEGTETAVRAVGTTFVVRTEPRGDQVTVLEGTVEVETHTKGSFIPVNRYDPGNPANPVSTYSPNNPFNPANRSHPDNPLNPVNKHNPLVPLDGGIGTCKQ